MEIGIISDTHDNIPNFLKAIDWFNKQGIELILHCGDISTEETLKEASQNFNGKILAVVGNMDENKITTIALRSKKSTIVDFLLRRDEKQRFKILGEIGELEIEGRKIAFTHLPETAKKLAKSGKYNFVFYGHTHKPWMEKVGECLLANPGNLAGILYKSTFAFYDTKSNRLELKMLEKL